jgi:hypothetical protein
VYHGRLPATNGFEESTRAVKMAFISVVLWQTARIIIIAGHVLFNAIEGHGGGGLFLN